MKKDSNLGQRLLKLIKHRGISQEELAGRVGCSQGTITKIVNNRSIGSKFLIKIAKELNSDPNWLELGIGLDATESGTYRTTIPNTIPLILWKEACIFQNKKIDIVPQKIIPYPHEAGMSLYALTIQSDLMISNNPHVRSFRVGEMIVVSTEIKAESGDYVLAKKDGTEEAIMQQYISHAGSEFLMSLNPQYPSIPLDDTVKIIGVVLSKIEMLK